MGYGKQAYDGDVLTYSMMMSKKDDLSFFFGFTNYGRDYSVFSRFILDYDRVEEAIESLESIVESGQTYMEFRMRGGEKLYVSDAQKFSFYNKGSTSMANTSRSATEFFVDVYTDFLKTIKE